VLQRRRLSALRWLAKSQVPTQNVKLWNGRPTRLPRKVDVGVSSSLGTVNRHEMCSSEAYVGARGDVIWKARRI
jgi:hypothetical protein